MRRCCVKAVNCSILVLLISTLFIPVLNPAYAHTAINVGDITIEAGWKNEPSLVGELNAVILKVSQQSKPFVIDPKSLTVEVKYGGVVKTMDIEPTEELGVYSSPIIPTRLGSYLVAVKGVVGGNNVNAEIPIEDVDDKQKLTFPDTSAESTELKNLASQIQSSVNQLQTTVDQAAGKISSAENSASEAKKLATDMRADGERTYSFGIIGMGLGAAGIVVAIAAMTRRRKDEGS